MNCLVFLLCRLCLCRILSGRHLVSSSYLTTTTSSSSTITGKRALSAKRCQKTPHSASFVAPSCASKAHAANSRVPVNAFWWAFQHTRRHRPFVCVCVWLGLIVSCSTPNTVVQLRASFCWSMRRSSSSFEDIVSASGDLFTLMPTERRTAISGMSAPVIVEEVMTRKTPL